MTFAPKDVETLKSEALEDLGLSDYEGNEEVVDRVVARLKSAEDLKMSLHSDKTTAREKLKETRKLAGLDPETGEKITTNVVEPTKSEGMTAKDVIAIRDLHEADLEFVMSEAKLRGQTIAEVKANPYIANTLKVMAEERKTAEATSTGTARKSNSNSDKASLLKRADSGKLADEEMGAAASETIKQVFGR